MNGKMVVLLIVSFVGLLYVWPNVVHEPLHMLALRVQGADGVIHFDWSHVPAHPSITRTTPVRGIAGGLFFLLLPSLVSLVILWLVWMTRERANMFSHFVLPIYLSFDLIINMVKYRGDISDFRFLSAVPGGVAIAMIAAIALMTWTGYLCVVVLHVQQEQKHLSSDVQNP